MIGFLFDQFEILHKWPPVSCILNINLSFVEYSVIWSPSTNDSQAFVSWTCRSYWSNLILCGHIIKYIVTVFINALPGNSSVNTAQSRTKEEAVFYVSTVTSRSGGWWSCDMCFLWCMSVPRLYKRQNSFGSGTSQFSVGDSHGKFVAEEEYKKLACEDLTCDLKT
jgi:hypothetical protein